MLFILSCILISIEDQIKTYRITATDFSIITGKWETVNGNLRSTSANNATITTDFFGVKLFIQAISFTHTSSIEVSIDDELIGTVFIPQRDNEEVLDIYINNSLSFGHHKLTLKHTGGINFALNSILVQPSIDNEIDHFTIPNCVQNAGNSQWQISSRDDYDYRCFTPQSATHTFTFYGSRFYLTGTNDPNHQTAKIQIDNGPEITLNEQAGIRSTFVPIYKSEVLPLGYHNVKVTATGVFEIAALISWRRPLNAIFRQLATRR